MILELLSKNIIVFSSISVFLLVIFFLVTIILIAEKKLVPQGNVKILINGDKMGLNYIDFKKHFFRNLIYPNAWLSIFYFIFRKIASIFQFK